MSNLGPYVEMTTRADGTHRIYQVWPKRIRPADWPATQFLLETDVPGPLSDEQAASVRAAAERNYLQFYDYKIGRGPPAPESDPWLGLIQREEASYRFRHLSPRTQELYKQGHDRILRDFRGRPELSPRRLKDHQIEAYLDSSGLNDFDARKFLTVLRHLIKRAVHEELRPPHLRMAVSMGPERESEVRLWEAHDVDYVSDFLLAHGHVGLSNFVLALWCLGQRMNDVRMFRYDAHYADGHFWFKTRKTNTPVFLQAPERLKARLDAQYVPGGHLFTDRLGRPWGTLKVAQAFLYMRSQMPAYAGQLLQLRQLRHSVVTDLALSGCTVPEIASVTRHKLESVHRILESYLPNHPLLAVAAQVKREQRHLHGLPGELLVEGERRIFIGHLPTPTQPVEHGRPGAMLQIGGPTRRPTQTAGQVLTHARKR